MTDSPETVLSEADHSAKAPEGKRRKTGGRKRGVPNKLTQDFKLTISERGKPIEFLADVCRGKKIRVGPQAGPAEPEYVYPTMEQRMNAARILANKLVADLRAQEVSGPDGAPLIPEDRQIDNFKIARQLVFMMAKAGEEAGLGHRHFLDIADIGKKESADDTTVDEIRDTVTRAPEPVVRAEPEKPTAPSPLEAEQPAPGCRPLGQEFSLNAHVTLFFNGYGSDGVERWHVVRDGITKSIHNSLDEAHDRGLVEAGQPSRNLT